MPSITAIVISAFGLIQFSSALPWSHHNAPATECPAPYKSYACASGNRGCSILEDECLMQGSTQVTGEHQHNSGFDRDCSANPGQHYYECSNGYNGCYAKDPCGFPQKYDIKLSPSECTGDYEYYDCNNKARAHDGCYTENPCLVNDAPKEAPQELKVSPAEGAEHCAAHPGFSYFECDNGYKGCYERDPCAHPAMFDPKSITECTGDFEYYDCVNGPWSHAGCYTEHPCPQHAPAAPPKPVEGKCTKNPDQLYYECSNGYNGCYPEDPCSLPEKKDIDSPSVCFAHGDYKYFDCINENWTHVGCYTESPCNQPTPQTNCDAHPGLSFYECSNGYNGCYAQDPCGLPAATKTKPTRQCENEGFKPYQCLNVGWQHYGCYTQDPCLNEW